LPAGRVELLHHARHHRHHQAGDHGHGHHGQRQGIGQRPGQARAHLRLALDQVGQSRGDLGQAPGAFPAPIMAR
jgi:hypothetical protein